MCRAKMNTPGKLPAMDYPMIILGFFQVIFLPVRIYMFCFFSVEKPSIYYGSNYMVPKI